MRSYKFEKETVPTAGVAVNGGAMLIGSVRNEHYKIILLKLDGKEELEWVKFYGGKNGWEGHSISKVNNSYLIGGAVEGNTTPAGGKNWKAYLAKIEENGGKVWERKYRILGNECVYSIVPVEDDILLGGKVSDGSGRSFFLMKTNESSEPLWTKTYGKWENAVFGGIVSMNDSIMLIGSSKNRNGWKIHLTRVDKEGGVFSFTPCYLNSI